MKFIFNITCQKATISIQSHEWNISYVGQSTYFKCLLYWMMVAIVDKFSQYLWGWENDISRFKCDFYWIFSPTL